MKLKETFDFVNGQLPSKGSVLLSEPFLQDPHFERSVVLICEHSDAESFGFVLNHKSAVQLKDLLDIAPANIPVFIGGPVANNSLFYLHTFADIESSEEILPGLFFGGDITEILERISKEKNMFKNIRFFIGYSGWSKGQLVQEIEERAWISVDNITMQTLLSIPSNQLWKKCLSVQGNQFQTFSIFPKNISDN
ncbi:MAG: YqgE/AlgH family protein [Flavobacteriales bacterium]